MKMLKSLSNQVYDYIVRQIKIGKFEPGDKIVETDLIEQLGISRTPIREALIQLSSDGILNSIPRKGFFVVRFDPKQVHYNYLIVARLDSYAAELVIDNMNADDYNKMDATIQTLDFAIKSRNYELYNDQQEYFHDVYLNKCENTELIELIHSLQRKYVRTAIYSRDEEKLYAFLLKVNEEHRMILQYFMQHALADLTQTIIDHWSMNKTNINVDFKF